MKWTILLAGVIGVALTGQASAQLFSEDFNDGSAGTRWSVVSHVLLLMKLELLSESVSITSEGDFHVEKA